MNTGTKERSMIMTEKNMGRPTMIFPLPKPTLGSSMTLATRLAAPAMAAMTLISATIAVAVIATLTIAAMAMLRIVATAIAAATMTTMTMAAATTITALNYAL